jgi:hypothetical protein
LEQAGITDEVAAFLSAHIDSIDRLEILLFLRQRASQSWSAAEVAKELRIGLAAAADQLARLAKDDLLTLGPRYRYAPLTPALAQAVDALERAYHERRVSIITLIFSKPNEKIRTFADAFKLRKDK